MLKEIVLIEWIAVNGLALVVWLAARRHEGLQKRWPDASGGSMTAIHLVLRKAGA